ncbi:calnexin isoform X2 [Teleopsis dalmanni]|uniref:calnexin isoform X2 n=1 Tax=Teleopsis dalmanni TaxID=139649 RepID=UPI0018CF5DFF|nr:calnexin isoform X2 [Teleopsis dalmanni]
MRVTNFFSSNAGTLTLVTLLLLGSLQFIATDTAEDFEDGEVEDVQDETTGALSDNGEELVYESPKYDASKFHFVDHFDNLEESRKRWTKSQAKKDDTAEEIAKYDGKWEWEAPQRIVWKKDIGLVLKSKAKHAAIAAPLVKPFSFDGDKPLVVQYEVTLQDGQECGGSYIKLLSEGKYTKDLTKFNDKTPYTIMFGPDKCGNDHKMHFIFRHTNPINGSISEKHCNKPKSRLEEPFKDKLPHLYQLVVRPDNTFEIRLDHEIINQGSLLTEFNPPVNPPREIDDPEDIKPKDWDEREKIPDPTAQKPADWDDDAPPQIPDPTAVKPDGWLDDEPDMIPDPTAQKPEDWDTEIDGEWEAPLVDNPVCEKAVGCGSWKAPLVPNTEYKGKWRAPLIDNPNYQGKWAARKIPNPDYFEDKNPFKMTPISAIGIELWSMSSDILFDNLLLTDDIAAALNFAEQTFNLKRKYIDKESETFVNKVMAYANANPWAWKIALFLICTPVVYSLTRMFSKKKDTGDDAKKTDEVQPDTVDEDDDVKEELENDDADKEVDTPLSTTGASHRAKKSDLDINEDNDAEEDNEADDATEEVNTEETEETASISPKGARKRRVRKDQS